MKTKLPLYLALLLLTQCSKCKKDDPAPVDQLPPATQSGANTFGCLVNGQPYTPQGRVGLGSNFDLSYDPGFNGGALIVRTYMAKTINDRKYLSVLGMHIARTGSYPFSSANEANAFYSDLFVPLPCDDYDSREPGTFSQGNLTVTRLDLAAGIVAGTFSFKLYHPGCDTLRVTQGRFDGKL